MTHTRWRVNHSERYADGFWQRHGAKHEEFANDDVFAGFVAGDVEK